MALLEIVVCLGPSRSLSQADLHIFFLVLFYDLSFYLYIYLFIYIFLFIYRGASRSQSQSDLPSFGLDPDQPIFIQGSYGPGIRISL